MPFHRPDAGLGLSGEAEATLRDARLLVSRFDIFRAVPDAEYRLLMKREVNGACLSCIVGVQYALYFPNGGAVRLDLSDAEGVFTMQWLDLAKESWGREKSLRAAVQSRLPLPTKVVGRRS